MLNHYTKVSLLVFTFVLLCNGVYASGISLFSMNDSFCSSSAVNLYFDTNITYQINSSVIYNYSYNPFNQELNTTKNVVFNAVNVTTDLLASYGTFSRINVTGNLSLDSSNSCIFMLGGSICSNASNIWIIQK